MHRSPTRYSIWDAFRSKGEVSQRVSVNELYTDSVHTQSPGLEGPEWGRGIHTTQEYTLHTLDAARASNQTYSYWIKWCNKDIYAAL